MFISVVDLRLFCCFKLFIGKLELMDVYIVIINEDCIVFGMF